MSSPHNSYLILLQQAAGLGAPLKGLCHGQNCLHLFPDSEAYHEQMDPMARSNGSLDSPTQCAYPEPSATHFSDRRRNRIGLETGNKQSCWCLHWSLGLGADVWKMLLQVRTGPVVTQVWREKMFNKNIEIVSECSFSPLSASVSAIIAQW